MSVDPATIADADLVGLHLDGGSGAFPELMRRHKAPLYRLIVAQTRDPDEALDLLQDTFVSAHDALARFDATRSLRAWLARIAINKCRDWNRRRRVRQWLARVLPIDAGESIVEPAVDAETQVIDRDRLARALDAVGALPPALREPLLLCTIEELSHAEAAQALGISVKAVETRIRRARAALSKARAGEG